MVGDAVKCYSGRGLIFSYGVSGRGVGKVVDVKLSEAGQGDLKEEEMVVGWRAAVVRTCEVFRKRD